MVFVLLCLVVLHLPLYLTDKVNTNHKCNNMERDGVFHQNPYDIYALKNQSLTIVFNHSLAKDEIDNCAWYYKTSYTKRVPLVTYNNVDKRGGPVAGYTMWKFTNPDSPCQGGIVSSKGASVACGVYEFTLTEIGVGIHYDDCELTVIDVEYIVDINGVKTNQFLRDGNIVLTSSEIDTGSVPVTVTFTETLPSFDITIGYNDSDGEFHIATKCSYSTGCSTLVNLEKDERDHIILIHIDSPILGVKRITVTSKLTLRISGGAKGNWNTIGFWILLVTLVLMIITICIILICKHWKHRKLDRKSTAGIVIAESNTAPIEEQASLAQEYNTEQIEEPQHGLLANDEQTGFVGEHEERDIKQKRQIKELQDKITEQDRLTQERDIKQKREIEDLQHRNSEQDRLAQERDTKQKTEIEQVQHRNTEQDRLAQERDTAQKKHIEDLQHRNAEQDRLAQERDTKQKTEIEQVQHRNAEQDRQAQERDTAQKKHIEDLQHRNSEQDRQAQERDIKQKREIEDLQHRNAEQDRQAQERDTEQKKEIKELQQRHNEHKRQMEELLQEWNARKSEESKSRRPRQSSEIRDDYEDMSAAPAPNDAKPK